MKETPVSIIERNFIRKAISEKKRLDGRSFNERRSLRIDFGNDWGCCHVALGETRVLAQVSCEVQQPKATRPNEGLLYINVDISPMAAVHIEAGRPSDECVQVNRVLEKCIKESRCVDLESLCIVADEKVWAIRVDINILNMDGNIVECASVAALAALAHFKRPDVTSTGERIIIHEFSEKDPLPMTLHHFPICLSYAIFHKGKHILADPTHIEEKVAEAHLNVGMNGYRELCGLHLGGKSLSNHESVLQCVQKAGVRAAETVEFIKKCLQEDEESRSKDEEPGFASCIQSGRITSLLHERMQVRINTTSLKDEAEKLMRSRMQNKHKTWDEDGNEIEKESSDEQVVVNLGVSSAELVDKEAPVDSMDEEDSESGSDDEMEGKPPIDEVENVSSPDIQEIEPTPKVKDSPKKKKAKITPKKTPKNKSKMKVVNMSDNSDDSDGLEVIGELTKEDKEKLKKVEELVLNDSEEEEETTTLTGADMETPLKSTPGKTMEKPNSLKKKKNKKKKKGKGGESDETQSRGWYGKNKW